MSLETFVGIANALEVSTDTLLNRQLTGATEMSNAEAQKIFANCTPYETYALRSEVAAFQNDESDNIWDFVSVDEYRKMEDELKKAYQYFEWNDRSGAYRYYEEIQKKVAAQVKDWKAINPRAEITSVRIMLFST